MSLFYSLDIQTRSGLPPPFRKFAYDQLKIQHQPHGAKVGFTKRNKEKILGYFRSPFTKIVRGGLILLPSQNLETEQDNECCKQL